jgi:hypothetical protein
MSNRLAEIARRKQLLIERCEGDRQEITASLGRVRPALGVGALLLTLGGFLKAYPVLVTGVSALLVSGYGGKLTKSAGQLLSLGQAIRPLWSWWAKSRKPK